MKLINRYHPERKVEDIEAMLLRIGEKASIQKETCRSLHLSDDLKNKVASEITSQRNSAYEEMYKTMLEMAFAGEEVTKLVDRYDRFMDHVNGIVGELKIGMGNKIECPNNYIRDIKLAEGLSHNYKGVRKTLELEIASTMDELRNGKTESAQEDFEKAFKKACDGGLVIPKDYAKHIFATIMNSIDKEKCEKEKELKENFSSIVYKARNGDSKKKSIKKIQEMGEEMMDFVQHYNKVEKQNESIFGSAQKLFFGAHKNVYGKEDIDICAHYEKVLSAMSSVL